MKIMRNALIATTALLSAAAIVTTIPSTAALAAQNQSQQVKAAANGANPQKLVNGAVDVVNKMKKDPQLTKLMQKAKGLYIVPYFGRGAFVVGGRGGAGLVTVKQNGGWSDPAFYDFGAISIGAQAGGSGGAVVFLLMNQSAVDAFKSGNKISLNAGAGLSIITYSANAQASWGKGDIIMWSDTKGAYAGATVSVSDINWADANNRAYYGKKTDMSAILSGKVSNASADTLTQELPG